MMRRTHAAAGLMIGLGLGASQAAPFPEVLILALVTEVSALLPDLDLKLHIKHRGITHSLLALFVIAALGVWIDTRVLQKEYSGLALALVGGYASHLLLDMLTVYGIELFYPSHRRIRLLRFRTGGRIDSMLAAASLCLGLVFLWRMI